MGTRCAESRGQEGASYTAAECLPQAASQQLIEETARKALEVFKGGKAPAPLKAALPVKIKLEFFNTGMADNASLMPNTTRLDGRTIEFQGASMLDAYLQFRAAVSLAS